MDGEKRITLLLRLGGDNVVVRRGPDGEDKLLQLHFGQLTSASCLVVCTPLYHCSLYSLLLHHSLHPTLHTTGSFMKHFPTKAKSYQQQQAAVATVAAAAAHAAAATLTAAGLPNAVSPPPQGAHHSSRPPASFAAAVAGSSSMGSSRHPSHTSSSSPTLQQQVERLSLPEPSGGSSSSLFNPGSPTMRANFMQVLGGSGTSSFANSPPGQIAMPPTTLMPNNHALHASQRNAAALSLLTDAMGYTNGLAVSTGPTSRSFSPTSMQLPNPALSAALHTASSLTGSTPAPATPDTLAAVEQWAASLGNPINGSSFTSSQGSPLASPQMQVLSVHGSQYSLLQAVSSTDSKQCSLMCRTAGTGLNAQLSLLQVYVPHPLHTCFFIDAADVTPGSWLHAELQQLLVAPSVTKVLHDGRRCVQALGDAQLALGPGLLDTRVMHSLLRELQRQCNGGATSPEPSKQVDALLQHYGLCDASFAVGDDPQAWARRPLQQAQLTHAAGEAAAMPLLAGLLQQELGRLMTGSWLAAASAGYCQGRPQDGFAQELGRLLQ